MKHPTIQAIEARLTNPERLAKFAKVAKMVYDATDDHAETITTAEIAFYLNRLELIDLNKHRLTEERGAAIFLEVLMAGLTFAPSADHIYLLPSWHNSSMLTYQIGPYGKLHLCQRAGSVDYITKPVIVYQGDTFHVGTNAEGRQVVLHNALQHPDNKPPIVAGYVFVVIGNNREPFWMDGADVARLRNKAKRNPLYAAANGDIDPGFFGGKLIGHALKPFRKKGIVSQIAEEEDETPEPMPIPTGEYQPTMIVSPPEQVQQVPPPVQTPPPQEQPYAFAPPPQLAF